MFDARYFYLVLMLRILLVSYFKEEFPDQVKLKPLTEKNYLCLFKNYSERGREEETEERTIY